MSFGLDIAGPVLTEDQKQFILTEMYSAVQRHIAPDTPRTVVSSRGATTGHQSGPVCRETRPSMVRWNSPSYERLSSFRKALGLNGEFGGSATRPANAGECAAHGAPVLLDDKVWMAEFGAWARAMPTPKAVLVVSAHWEQRPTTLGATQSVPLVYDFYGFPEKSYRTTYPCPGAPELAQRARGLLSGRGMPCAADERRGLDHGAYVPLVAMYPEASVPVLQVSMPVLRPRRAGPAWPRTGTRGGRGRAAVRQRLPDAQHALRLPARHPDVGSGIRRVGGGCAHSIRPGRAEGLRKPGAVCEAGPAHVGALRAASGLRGRGWGAGPKVSFPITGWWMDSAFTKRSVQFG